MVEVTALMTTTIKVLRAALTVLIDVRRRRLETAKRDLHGTAVQYAYSAVSASTLRGGRVELVSKSQMRAALELQREGKGSIRAGFYEVYINTIPAAIQQAMFMRGASAGARYW